MQKVRSSYSLFTKGTAFQLIKLVLFGGLLYLLFKRWVEAPLDTKVIKEVFQNPYSFILLAISLLLIFPNWLMEGLIWKKLLAPFFVVEVGLAFKSVLSGLVLGIFTPFMTGDYVGRTILLPKQVRKEAIGANLTGSYIFTLLSIHLGTLGLGMALFLYDFQQNFFGNATFFVLLFASIAGTLLVFYKLPKAFLSFAFLEPYLHSLRQSSFTQKLAIYALALGRYGIFTFQFLLLFLAFGVWTSFFHMLAGILVIFLAKTIGSSLNVIGDLGARELVGIAYFSSFGNFSSQVIWVIFIIWLWNILLPSAIGAYYINLAKNVVD